MRLYLERYEADPARHEIPLQEVSGVSDDSR